MAIKVKIYFWEGSGWSGVGEGALFKEIEKEVETLEDAITESRQEFSKLDYWAKGERIKSCEIRDAETTNVTLGKLLWRWSEEESYEATVEKYGIKMTRRPRYGRIPLGWDGKNWVDLRKIK